MSNTNIPNNSLGISSAMPSRPQNSHTSQLQQQGQLISPRPNPSVTHIMPNISAQQQSSGFRANSSTPLLPDNNSSHVSSPGRTQPLISPASISPAPISNQYHPYEHPR